MEDEHLNDRAAVCQQTGISYPVLHRWTAAGYLHARRLELSETGRRLGERLWPDSEVVVATLMKRLTDADLGVRAAAHYARHRDTIGPGLALLVDLPPAGALRAQLVTVMAASDLIDDVDAVMQVLYDYGLPIEQEDSRATDGNKRTGSRRAGSRAR